MLIASSLLNRIPCQTEYLKVKGHWRLTARHIVTDETIIQEGHNLIVTVGLTWLLHYLINDGGYTNGFTYCALGNDNTAPVIGDTVLGSEQSRKAITLKGPVNVGDTDVILSTFFTAAQSTFYLKEAGIFGHDAGAGADSGTLWSRWITDFDNSLGAYDITIDYTLSLSTP